MDSSDSYFGKETQYHGWDTVRGIFEDELIIGELENYSDYICFGQEGTETEYFEKSDFFRYIFSSVDRIKEFLSFMRNAPFFSQEQDISKIVTFILSIQKIWIDFQTTPLSVTEIFSQKIVDILNFGKDNTYVENAGEDESNTYENGLRILVEDFGYTPITTEGELVFYYSEHPSNKDLIYVCNEKGEILLINKEGEIISEIDESNKQEHKLGVIAGTRKGEKEKKGKARTNRKGTGAIERGDGTITHDRFKGRISGDTEK